MANAPVAKAVRILEMARRSIIKARSLILHSSEVYEGMGFAKSQLNVVMASGEATNSRVRHGDECAWQEQGHIPHVPTLAVPA